MMSRTLASLAVLALVLGSSFGIALAQETPTTSSPPTVAPTSSVDLGMMKLNGLTFNHVRPVASRYKDLSEAVAVTAGNGLDEIYLKDQDGKLYIAYGEYGDLDKIQVGQDGTCAGKILRVVHTDNEMNRFTEGAIEGCTDIWKTIVKPLIDNAGTTALTAAGVSAAFVGLKVASGMTLAAATPALMAAAVAVAPYAAMAAGAVSLFMIARKITLALAKKNTNTIAMVTGESVDEIDRGMQITPDQKRDRGVRDTGIEVLRRSGPPLDNANLGQGSGVGPGYDDLPVSGR